MTQSRQLSALAMFVPWTIILVGSIQQVQADDKMSPEEVKSVVVVYSNESVLPANVIVDRVLREQMQYSGTARIELFSEYLDIVRFPDPHHLDLVTTHLHQKFSDRKIDLVIAGGSSALEFLLEHRETLFSDAPLMYSCVDSDRIESDTALAALPGVPMQEDAAATVALAVALQPKATKLYIVSGASQLDRRWQEKAETQLARFAGELQFEFISGLPLDKLLDRVRSIPEGEIVLFLLYMQDGRGQHCFSPDVLQRVSESSPSPVYGVYNTYHGRGIVGGHFATFEELGMATARLGLKILDDGVPERQAWVNASTPARAHLDWRQLRRWNLNQANLPDGIVDFRQLSAWEQYPGRIIAATALIIFQAALIFFLLIEFRRRRIAEKQRLASQGQATFLAGKLLSAQEDERKRIARELHDDLSQRLAASAIELGKLEKIQHYSAKERAVVDQVRGDIVEVSDDMHSLSRQIHPAILDDLGLIAALRGECDRLSVREGIEVDFQAAQQHVVLPKDVSLCLYRVAQEALWNAARYSKTDRIEVELDAETESVEMLVRDFGIGFAPAATSGHGGLGLASMRERVRLVNGQLDIRSESRGGTSIGVKIPLTAS